MLQLASPSVAERADQQANQRAASQGCHHLSLGCSNYSGLPLFYAFFRKAVSQL